MSEDSNAVSVAEEPVEKAPYFPNLEVAGKLMTFDHLEPFVLIVETNEKPEGVRVNVVFSNHCFSETFDGAVHTGECIDVWDRRVRRVFDQARYTLSLQLPGIIQGLPNSHVYLTHELNFVRIALPETNGQEYRIFFNIKKAAPGLDHDLRLFVESAYTPDRKMPSPAEMTKVRFKVLVDKTLRGEKLSRHHKR